MVSIAKRRTPGTTSRNSSNRLAAISVDWRDKPVTLPPGRAKLATRPLPIGSFAAANIIGMIDVACFAAITAAVEYVMMTSTLSRTNSAAISVKRSGRPSAQRTSSTTVRPSIQPSSRSRWTKAGTHCPWTAGAPELSNPIFGNFPDCCARAASGHAAAPLSSVMNARRLIRSPRRPAQAASAARRGRAPWRS